MTTGDDPPVSTKVLTARTSAADAPYFTRTSSNERGAATDFAVIRKAFFITSVILA
jgi:hypothetical protein